jgi:hypothetical protein
MELVGGKMEKKFPIVKILWHDACSSDHTAKLGDDFFILATESVGFLIKKNKDMLTIVTNVNPNNNGYVTFRGTMSIPMGMVRKIIYLKESK